MKRVKEFFQMLGLLALLVLYPAVSFNWYRFCRVKSHKDVKMFIWYGVLGIVGIFGMAMMWFVPMPWNAIVGIVAAIPYGLGFFLQTNLIRRKKRELVIF